MAEVPGLLGQALTVAWAEAAVKRAASASFRSSCPLLVVQQPSPHPHLLAQMKGQICTFHGGPNSSLPSQGQQEEKGHVLCSR